MFITIYNFIEKVSIYSDGFEFASRRAHMALHTHILSIFHDRATGFILFIDYLVDPPKTAGAAIARVHPLHLVAETGYHVPRIAHA